MSAEPPSSKRSTSRSEIVLHNPCRYPEASARRLRPWLTRLVTALAPAPSSGTTSLGVRFTSDREMRRLSSVYRGKNGPTDVLSFPGEETPEGGRHLGDVAISVPTARRQAAAAGHEVERELRLLLLHGLLHCLGYDHEVDEGEMEKLEAKLRRRWLEEAP